MSAYTFLSDKIELSRFFSRFIVFASGHPSIPFIGVDFSSKDNVAEFIPLRFPVDDNKFVQIVPNPYYERPE